MHQFFTLEHPIEIDFLMSCFVIEKRPQLSSFITSCFSFSASAFLISSVFGSIFFLPWDPRADLAALALYKIHDIYFSCHDLNWAQSVTNLRSTCCLCGFCICKLFFSLSFFHCQELVSLLLQVSCPFCQRILINL